jgi:hypothetical protein
MKILHLSKVAVKTMISINLGPRIVRFIYTFLN